MNIKKKTLSLVAAAFCAAACSHMNAQAVKLKPETEGAASIAKGEVRTIDSSNDNKRVWVKIEHLAPPEKVADGATTYVVWAQPEGGATPQNIGALKVDDELEGSLMTVVPYDNFRLFITPEPSAQVTEPSGEEILAASLPQEK
jgi:hypothetical protein